MSLIKENTFKQLQFNIPDATEVLQDLIKIKVSRCDTVFQLCYMINFMNL